MNLIDLAELQKQFNLTPAEINKVAYHRSNLANPGVDPEGNPITIYASGIEIPEGPDKGKFVSVPGFVNGQVVENDDELWDIWKKDILAGNYPIYKSAEELNKRDKELHQIMDLDMQAITPPAQYSNPFQMNVPQSTIPGI